MDITVVHDYSDDAIRNMDIAGLASMVASAEGRPQDTECSISFVTNERIAELNQLYRDKEGPTDVLSFECDNVKDSFVTAFDDDAPYELGDIVIATDVALRQAQEHGCTLQEEVELLCVHGLLHLCGYDHIDDDEARIMEAREHELLATWRARS